MTLLTTLAVLWAFRVWEEPSGKSALVTGALIGTAVSSNHNGFTCAFPLALALVLPPAARAPAAPGRASRLLMLAAAGLVSVAVFALWNPLFVTEGASTSGPSSSSPAATPPRKRSAGAPSPSSSVW